ncbi:MAG: hypothetical protein ABI130_01260 [Leifsonia sp.]
MTALTSTRALLLCQAFGALGALLLIVVAPFTSLVAVFSPPLYGLAAGMHSILPFFARRVLGFPFAATAVSASVGFLGGAFTPIGLLIMIPLTLSGFSYDLTLLVANRVVPVAPTSRWRYPLAAAASAVALFLVSLPVMSPEHLTLPVQSATLGARLAGQLAASFLAGLLARRVGRAGIIGPVAAPQEERTSA